MPSFGCRQVQLISGKDIDSMGHRPLYSEPFPNTKIHAILSLINIIIT